MYRLAEPPNSTSFRRDAFPTPSQLCDEPEEAGILPRASIGAIGQAGEDESAWEVGPWGSGTSDVGDHSPKRFALTMRTHTTTTHHHLRSRAGVACRSNLRQPRPRPSSFRNSESKVCEGSLACTHCPALPGIAGGRPDQVNHSAPGTLERRLSSEEGTNRGALKKVACDESTSSCSARRHRTTIGARSTALAVGVVFVRR